LVVDNRPGAASMLGTDLVAKSAPDGHTLLLADLALTINPAYYTRQAPPDCVGIEALGADGEGGAHTNRVTGDP